MMSNIEYDLDLSGGLMSQVQALIAPPVSEDASKNKKPEKSEHPYFRRPGKGHNHDTCDACSEGGDLICCDKCPASFHLTCHDPPLSEDSIPAGQWLCHQCCKTKELTTTTATVATPQTRTTKRSNSTPAAQSGTSTTTTNTTTAAKRTKLNPMEVLVQAASMLNPRQFELPRQMSAPCIFPGTDKVENLYYNNSNHRSKARNYKMVQKAHELAAGGMVPLPARTCFECRRSCRVGVLISCDYCPLLFHMDCLDPPLTALPAGRWMCPNHVEQYIDSKLVTSVSATERMRLWDRFTGPVDQDAIKMEFIRRVHNKNPPFRFKIKLSTRKKVIVPPMIKYHYSNPVALLPSLRDILRLETVLNRERDLEAVEKVNGQLTDVCNGQSSEEFSPTVNGVAPVVKQETSVINGAQTSNSNNRIELCKFPEIVTGIHCDIERELKQLDDRLIRLLAYQRIQNLLSQQNEGTSTNLASLIANSLQNFRPRHMPLPSELLTPADIDRISRVFTSPKKTKPFRSRSQLRTRAILCPVVSKHFYNVRTSEVDPVHVRHDASFMGYRPTVSARFPEAAAMRYRSLTIGRGCANDVELERYGHCNFTSAKHAVIFYDECTKHYELINYSEYGSQVNNILYSFDYSDRSTAGGDGDNKDENTTEEKQPAAANIVTTVRDIVDKKRKVIRPKRDSPLLEGRMIATDTSDHLECNCGTNGPVNTTTTELSAGWEGTAILNHGALLKFGCVAFVFSIVECATTV